MGCCDSKQSLSKNQDQDQVRDLSQFMLTINSLGFQNHSSRLIDNVFHRYSYSDMIQEKQFSIALNRLGLKPDMHAKFYESFVINANSIRKKYILSARKLCTLGILLGNSPEDEKVKLLFQNYDRNTNNAIENSEARAILEDILDLSLVKIPDLVLEIFRADAKVVTTAERMKLMKEPLKIFYIDQFVGEKRRISSEEFESLMAKEEFRKLLRVRELQEFSLNIEKKIETSGELKKTITASLLGTKA